MNEEAKIIEELEDAIEEYKISSDKRESKARIDRLLRKAEVYGTNPQIQLLLKKIKKDLFKNQISDKGISFGTAIINYCKNHKILTGIGIFIMFGCIVSLFTEESIDGSGRSEIQIVNDAIDNGDFATAYDIVDKNNDADLNSKVLSSEITYIIGDEELSPEVKASKIILTVKERAKHNDRFYRVDDLYDIKTELLTQKSLLETAILTAKSSGQNELSIKLQEALSLTDKSLKETEREIKESKN